jgi:CrcB protein
VQAYLWIAFGSALGGMARYWCTGAATRLFGDTFPWGTLLINIVGSLIIGFFVALTGPDGRYAVDQNIRLFATVGLCGGFTTFSAFSLQSMVLMQEGEWLHAGAYVLASVAVCLLAVWAGHLLATQINAL